MSAKDTLRVVGRTKEDEEGEGEGDDDSEQVEEDEDRRAIIESIFSNTVSAEFFMSSASSAAGDSDFCIIQFLELF